MSSTAAETSKNASAPTEAIEEIPIVTPSNFPSHVTVKFTTNTYPDKVSEAPFKVPSDLTRFGLSEVVNTLLKTSPAVPFEFLTVIKSPSGEMKKVFLRSSLKKFFIKIQQYPESVITLEYIEAYPAPKQVDTIPHDDWVSAIAVVDDLIVTGCYDGLCRIISNDTGAVLASVSHQKSSGGVKSVSISRDPSTSAAASSSTSNIYYILTCTNDEHARLWKFDRKAKSCSFVAPLKDHTFPVNAVQFNHKGNMAITASSDKTVKLWDIFSTNAVSNKENEDKQPEAKKQKVGEKFQPSVIGTMAGHVLPITCMHWHSTPSDSTLVTGSHDHTIRLWDVTKGQTTCTLQGSKVVSTLSYNPSKNLVLSGHPDFLIRMWDARAQTNRASLFRSHKGWVRGVEWLSESEYEFASGGDDNLLKIWDTRAGSVPVHSIPHHVLKEGEKQTEEFKVLTIKTNKPKQLLSGSTDCTLKKHSFTE